MTAVMPVARFDDWRAVARRLLAAHVPPREVLFTDPAEPTLFAGVLPPPPPAPAQAACRVPQLFLALAEAVGCHRDPARWHRLYRVLWRLTRGEPHLLDLAADDDVRWLHLAERAVRRDTHKMHAFVRFRAVGGEFVAWHRPDHLIVRRAAPFFARRFPDMDWAILTPDESVTWDGTELRYGAGVPRAHAPRPDELEPLWAAYYRSTFNPARIKLKAMRKELPVRHWPTLPETTAIADLLAEAPARVAEMVRHAEGGGDAEEFLPPDPTPGRLREALPGCRACGLCGPPAVAGGGPMGARLVLVGEQPGEDDEREGRPFGGAAGGVLEAALRQAGLRREDVYVTHAVKHRPRTDAGVTRRASVREGLACRPWLLAELACVRPAGVVALGAGAARAVFGPLFRFAGRRGEVVPLAGGARGLATHSPAVARTVEQRADLARHLALAVRLAAGRV